MTEPFKLVLLIYGLLFVFYVPLLLFIRSKKTKRFAQRRFCRGIISIYEATDQIDEVVPQIQILHKRLAERYGNLGEYFRSATEMLEDLLILMDVTEESSFKGMIGVDPPKDKRDKLIASLKLIKELQPYSSLSSKQGNMLNMLRHSIDTDNKDLAKNTIKQLSDEIEVMEGSMRRQEMKNRISISISIIGVILTVFFGAVSFIQFLK